MAGTRGSRTHRAAPGAASLVLKTRGPTGTHPLPSSMVARPQAAAADAAASRAPEAAYHRRMTTLDAAAAGPPDRPDRLRRLRREARCRPAGRRPARPRRPTHRGARRALIAGLDPPDDAAAYRISDDLAIIGTLDFFPPLVDDPRTFGEIAAANALSDVFAMGGRVLFALSIAAFPEDLPRDVLAAIFDGAVVQGPRGGRDAGRRPHDPRPGAEVRPRGDRGGASRPAPAQGRRAAGRCAPATKRLGTGLLVSGSRQGKTTTEHLGGAIDQMRTLNRAASEVLVARGVRGGDRRDRVRAARTRPRDGPSVRHAVRVRRGRAPGPPRRAGARGGRRRDRRRGAQPSLRAPALTVGADVVAPELVTLAHDPQTSGGLLAAIPAAEVDDVTRALNAAGVQAWRVGRVEAGEPGVAADLRRGP